jgi:hypothetical protein
VKGEEVISTVTIAATLMPPSLPPLFLLLLIQQRGMNSPVQGNPAYGSISGTSSSTEIWRQVVSKHSESAGNSPGSTEVIGFLGSVLDGFLEKFSYFE